MKASRCLTLLIVSCISLQTTAEKITVAVASNFSGAMAEIVAAFEQQSGHEVDLAFGSSGKFFAQISNGAPFQAFFSADQDKPRSLEQKGLAVPGSRFTYAVGALVLWSAKPAIVDEQASVLKQGNFNKIAIANPRLAPYGAAAVQTLENLGLKDATEAKWVQGENIAQTYQFVVTGNADIGFIALSQIIDHGEVNKGSAWIVPGELHQPIRQDAALLLPGKDSAAAREFLAFVRGEKAAAIIAAYGYETEQQN